MSTHRKKNVKGEGLPHKMNFFLNMWVLLALIFAALAMNAIIVYSEGKDFDGTGSEFAVTDDMNEDAYGRSFNGNVRLHGTTWRTASGYYDLTPSITGGRMSVATGSDRDSDSYCADLFVPTDLTSEKMFSKGLYWINSTIEVSGGTNAVAMVVFLCRSTGGSGEFDYLINDEGASDIYGYMVDGIIDFKWKIDAGEWGFVEQHANDAKDWYVWLMFRFAPGTDYDSKTIYVDYDTDYRSDSVNDNSALYGVYAVLIGVLGVTLWMMTPGGQLPRSFHRYFYKVPGGEHGNMSVASVLLLVLGFFLAYLVVGWTVGGGASDPGTDNAYVKDASTFYYAVGSILFFLIGACAGFTLSPYSLRSRKLELDFRNVLWAILVGVIFAAIIGYIGGVGWFIAPLGNFQASGLSLFAGITCLLVAAIMAYGVFNFLSTGNVVVEYSYHDRRFFKKRYGKNWRSRVSRHRY